MTLRDPDAVDGWLGIPLEPAEDREFDRRNTVGEALSVAQAHLGRVARAAFAGAWLDQEAGGVAVFATTDPSTLPASAVSPWLPPGSRVEVRAVAHSEAELDTVFRRVAADMTSVPWVRAAADSVGTFLMGNEVLLQVRPATSPAVLRRLHARYGPCLTVEVDPTVPSLDDARATP